MVMNDASMPEIPAQQMRDAMTWQMNAISKRGDSVMSVPYLILHYILILLIFIDVCELAVNNKRELVVQKDTFYCYSDRFG